jgi:hypothetical protein
VTYSGQVLAVAAIQALVGHPGRVVPSHAHGSLYSHLDNPRQRPMPPPSGPLPPTSDQVDRDIARRMQEDSQRQLDRLQW